MQTQPQSRYSEPDSRDWRGRSPQVEEKSWETLKSESRQQEANQYNRQDQLSSQFGRAQISSNQGVRYIYSRWFIFLF